MRIFNIKRMTCVNVIFPIVKKGGGKSRRLSFLLQNNYTCMELYGEFNLHSVLTIMIIAATTEINQIIYPRNDINRNNK